MAQKDLLSLRDTTGLVGVVCQATSLVARLSTLCESSGQLCSVVSGVDVIEEGWVCKVGLNNSLWVDEEVLSGTRDTGIFIGERGDEHSWFAVVVEFPVKGTHGADDTLVQTDSADLWKIYELVSTNARRVKSE